ncbi:TIGR03086 family metal-binding protein [Knoellia sp. LjRoot47]|uniref:TIGR03086 family metal-binding protein n=1 Tax=Knoellia sp. LjRoot47 TaxID=3342330 RepID=UPI003ECD824D
MSSQTDAGALLTRALDQTAGLLDEVSPDHYDKPSTCQDWTVGDLVKHVVASPQRFADMAAGQDVDWASTPDIGDDPAAEFRSSADELAAKVTSGEAEAISGAALPEYAVHGWDLAHSIHSDTTLDDEVAEQALAFMRDNLTPDNRKGVFGPEVEASDDAPIQDRLAAFAGRTVPAS